MSPPEGHIPVLHDEDASSGTVLSVLNPQPGETVLDVTLGLGGHASAFLRSIGPTGRLIGIDADAENLRTATKKLSAWKDQATFIHGNFRNIASLELPHVDIIFADLGLSSPHIDDPKRGFTFRTDAPLDMRFDRTQGMTAADFLAAASEADIARTFRELGELRHAGRLAHVLYHEAHHGHPVRTTRELAGLIEKLFGYRAPSILPQVFQALRMQVNDELGALQKLLSAAPSLLKPGGRIAVISYHSLEDRMVKQTFRALTTAVKDPSTGAVSIPAPFTLLTRKPIRPSEEEIRRNPRSRSALLRAIRKAS